MYVYGFYWPHMHTAVIFLLQVGTGMYSYLVACLQYLIVQQHMRMRRISFVYVVTMGMSKALAARSKDF